MTDFLYPQLIQNQSENNCCCGDECCCELAESLFSQLSPDILSHFFAEKDFTNKLRYELVNGLLTIQIKFNTITKKSENEQPRYKVSAGINEYSGLKNAKKFKSNCCGRNEKIEKKFNLDKKSCGSDKTQILKTNEQNLVEIEEISSEYSEESDSENDSKNQIKITLNKPIYKCKFKNCEKSYKYETSLRKHLLVCEKSDVNATSKTLQYLEKQIINQNKRKILINSKNNIAPKTKTHICHICKKSFGQRHHMQRHIEQVHSKSRPFLCKTCGKDFKDKYNFRVHTRIHTGERPFVCNICENNFTQKSALISHYNVHKQENLGARMLNTSNISKLKSPLKFSIPNNTKHPNKPHDELECDKMCCKNKDFQKEVQKIFKCEEDFCDFETSARETLLDHKKEKHSLSNFPGMLNNCSVEFSGCDCVILRTNQGDDGFL